MIGTLIGVLPGIGPLATLAMLLPATFYLPPVPALIMLAGIYYGAIWRLDHRDPGQRAGRIVFGRDLSRRPSDGTQGPGRSGARHRRARLAVRRHSRDLHHRDREPAI